MPKWRKKRRQTEPKDIGSDHNVLLPLREFVYLDDVSLRSLLASQTGELTTEVTELLSKADEAELASSIGAGSPLLKADLTARLKASSSSGRQTSRKAVAQSLFKELRERVEGELVLRPDVKTRHSPSDQVDPFSQAPVRCSDLRRGDLIEVEVELAADPVFEFSTIASEVTQMTRQFPEMFGESEARDMAAMVDPGSRLIEQFLVGLIPLRARCTSHVAVVDDLREVVTSLADAEARGLTPLPLTIVGVTERDSYWRDVRRVLFARSRFTMLCRVTSDGIRSSWQPVKLLDVFRSVAPHVPDLVWEIDSSNSTPRSRREHSGLSSLSAALEYFIEAAETSSDEHLTSEAVAAARDFAKNDALDLAGSVTGENEAFRQVKLRLSEGGCVLSPDSWLELKQDARQAAGLSLFDAAPHLAAPSGEQLEPPTKMHRLVDTEVIAIYW